MTGKAKKHPLWTEAETEMARRLWCDGMPVAAILDALVEAGYARKEQKSLYVRRREGNWPARVQVGVRKSEKRRPVPPRLIVSDRPVVPPGKGTHLMDLRLGSCRWPLWPDGPRAGFDALRFCGEPVARIGAPYCPACAAKASGGKIAAHDGPEPTFKLYAMGGRR